MPGAAVVAVAAVFGVVCTAGAQTPAAPVPPEVLTRDADGRVVVRAIALEQPLRVDGALDEALYRDVAPLTGFIQVEPRDGAPATDQTEVWLAYDEDHVYVSVRALDSAMDLIATEMRRDNNTIYSGNDYVGFMFDPFYDRRNSVSFTVSPLGARQDGQVSNERQYNGDWNPVWDVKTGRFEAGWTIEAAIPFKSLRYGSGDGPWGFNVIRMKRSKNELSALTDLNAARGQQAMQQVSLSATVIGLRPPAGRRPLDIKPYVTTNVTTDRSARVVNDPGADIGLDVKYAVTQGLTGDFTWNTDFAQVEADEQQVNLTRFSLFFPEKREFFLENQGTFVFGGVPVAGTQAGQNDAPILFYSRRIGLNNGRPVPLEVGGRVTGRAGAYSIGLINIQTGDEPTTPTRSTNFSVVRVKRDVLQRSSIGLLVTGRSVAQAGSGSNIAYGVDGTFAFFDNLVINSYWARTQTGGRRGDDTSLRAQLDYTGDRYGVQIERLDVGDNFNPEIGFVRRDDMRRSFALFRFSPRLAPSRPLARRIRRFFYQASVAHVGNGGGTLETRERAGEFAIEFQNADRFSVWYGNHYEFLPRPFPIASAITLPVGSYDFDNLKIGFNMGQQRPVGANLTLERGSFYNGSRTSLSAARGRVKLTTRLSAEPTYTINRVRLAEGQFTSHLAGARVTYTMTPMMFTSAFVQYNSAIKAVSANVRFRWEYQPGSELFVVFNEERDTLARRFPDLTGRAFIVKVNRLFRF